MQVPNINAVVLMTLLPAEIAESRAFWGLRRYDINRLNDQTFLDTDKLVYFRRVSVLVTPVMRCRIRAGASPLTRSRRHRAHLLVVVC